jgi:hypothetical protein
MPLSGLNALPRKVASALPDGPVRRALEPIEVGRYVTVAGAVLLGWLIFRWAGRLYGPAAGLLALTLYVLDPNILAHGGLITVDVFAAGMITLTVWAFWRFLNHEGPGRKRVAALSVVTFGLAQLAKYTAAYLVPILLLIAGGYAGPALWGLARRRDWRGLGGRLMAFAGYAGLYLAAAVLVVNAGYWGQDTGRPLAGARFLSRELREVQTTLRGAPGLRIPAPWDYVAGLDWALSQDRGGTNVYLLGELGKGGVRGRRFPEYFAVGWLVKEPIAIQLLLFLAVGAYLARLRRFDFRRNEWFLACPVLFFAWYLTCVFNFQIGYRHALVVLPFVFVFTGSLLRDAASGRGPRLLLGGLLLYLVVSTLSYYPHFIPYFNEIVWDRTTGYRILIDSNLDWRQDGWYVTRYLRRHPGTILDPAGPTAGTILLSADIAATGHPWLRENFRPVGHVAYAHLIFRVTPEALRRVTDPLPADSADKDR